MCTKRIDSYKTRSLQIEDEEVEGCENDALFGDEVTRWLLIMHTKPIARPACLRFRTYVTHSDKSEGQR